MNRRKKNAKPDTSAGVTLAPPLSVQKAIAKDLADEPTDVDPFAIAKDLRDHAPPKKEKAKKLPKPDPMERKLAEAVAEAKAPAETQPMEATVKTKSKSKAKATNGSGKKTKVQIIAELLQRKQGCTTEDVLKATGWPAVSMPQQAKAAGLKLKKEKDGNVTRYRAG